MSLVGTCYVYSTKKEAELANSLYVSQLRWSGEAMMQLRQSGLRVQTIQVWCLIAGRTQTWQLETGSCMAPLWICLIVSSTIYLNSKQFQNVSELTMHPGCYLCDHNPFLLSELCLQTLQVGKRNTWFTAFYVIFLKHCRQSVYCMVTARKFLLWSLLWCIPKQLHWFTYVTYSVLEFIKLYSQLLLELRFWFLSNVVLIPFVICED